MDCSIIKQTNREVEVEEREERFDVTAVAGPSNESLHGGSFFVKPRQRPSRVASPASSRRALSPAESTATGLDGSFTFSDEEDAKSVSSRMSASSKISVGSVKRKGKTLSLEDCVELATQRRKYLKVEGATPKSVDAALGIVRKKHRLSKPLPSERKLAEQMISKSLEDLHGHLDGTALMVEQVADTSGNLKATYIRELRVAALNAKAAAEEMSNRTDPAAVSETTQQVQKENARLKAEIRKLREEMEAMKEELRVLKSSRRRILRSPSSSPVRSLVPKPLQQSEGNEMEVEQEERRDERPARSPVLTSVRKDRRGEKRERSRLISSPADNSIFPPTSPDEILMDRIGKLMEAKLTAFREELFPGRAIRPPLMGIEANKAPPPVPPSTATAKGKGGGGRKEQKGKAGWVAPPPSSSSSIPESKGKDAPSTNKPPSPDGESWALVVGRRKKGKENRSKQTPAPPKSAKSQPTPKGGGSERQSNGGIGAGQAKAGKGKETGVMKVRPGRLPKTAAVAITAPEGTSYAAVLTRAKQNICLANLGITDALRFKRAVTGAYLIEVPGEGSAQKADRLQEELGKVFQDTGVKVARPTKRMELRIRGLDDSISTMEVAQAVAHTGECRPEEIKTGEIKFSPYGLGTVWIQCPLAAARKVAAAGKIKVGWTLAPVELLEKRPLQCYRCLEKGHVSSRCTNTVDRSGRCYRCGDKEHRASQCTATPKCPLCADLGKPADHRLGAKTCKPAMTRRGGRGANKDPSKSTVEKGPGRNGTTSSLKKKKLQDNVTEKRGQEEAMVIGDDQ